ncbi:uncharacterized protein YjbK [Aneurinibacillus soli]|uniref:CYTH domain protein n=1 Tax=Aneurinibacillus soli TaxID=1500254 RepID=A0A0U4NBI7_9BACL|nr:CYTH domain-containing protein [Aneurinibacillus soli]PYE60123.1 uncharacterized protein YjbK [Aneurinibacillus soli]BAU26388.1 CYTH domain protein [Aneurinibacillus soli]
MKEQELKLLLDRKAYEKLLEDFPNAPVPVKQINYYFDTPDFYLGRNKIMLRVRQEKEHFILCAKILQDASGSSLICTELEQTIPATVFEQGKQNADILLSHLPAEGQQAIRSLVSPEQISLRGALENERCLLPFSDSSYTYELDRTLFPGNNEAYELEIEGVEDEDACRRVMENLTAHGYTFTPHKESKYKRFQEAAARLL